MLTNNLHRNLYGSLKRRTKYTIGEIDKFMEGKKWFQKLDFNKDLL